MFRAALVQGPMAAGAQRNQIVQLVFSEGTSKLNMVDLKLVRSTAMLAFPAVPFENAPT